MRPPVRSLGLAVAWLFLFLALGGPMATADDNHGGAPTIALCVDATEAPRRIFHARLELPVQPGPLTLLYPKWIPGTHGPSGPIADLAGLRIRADGRSIPWHRDDLDMFAFHCDVPAGCRSLAVSYDYLAPQGKAAEGSGAEESASATPRLAMINWNSLILYPRGTPVRDLHYRAELRLPPGWKFGTALGVEEAAAENVRFQPVSLETLIDSPVLCGAHFRSIPIGPDRPPRHFLEMACDGEEGLKVDPETKAHFDRLVAEAGALFGARHYASYHFLVALSDHLPATGLEHHESSDNRLPERTLVDDKTARSIIDLFAHEYVHSWNGKYRRPTDMAADDYQRPLKTKLVWIYEGLTQYLGTVLTARCGLWSADEFREYTALVADRQRNQRGRAWRPLEDTAVGAQLLYSARSDWAAWRRSLDFYDEGFLIWLEVDALIRTRSEGRHALDDVCRRVFGGQGEVRDGRPYTLDEFLAELEAVAPYDWKNHFLRRVANVNDEAPLDGLDACGWRQTFGDSPSSMLQSFEHDEKMTDLNASIGLSIDDDGEVLDVIPGKAADRAGIGPGMKLIAVNSRRYTSQLLRSAIAATTSSKAPLELLVENDDFFRSHPLDYHGGARYPRIERDPARPDLLSQVIAPRAGHKPPADDEP